MLPTYLGNCPNLKLGALDFSKGNIFIVNYMALGSVRVGVMLYR